MARQATINDITSIRAMAEVVFRETYREILSPAQMEYMIEMMYSEESLHRQMTRRGDVFFVEEDRGYVSIRPDGTAEDGRPRFHLEKIYVMPDGQGTGLGRQLFQLACGWAKEQAGGAPALVELNVNRGNPAVGFYEHLGMVRARSGDFPIGNGFYMNDYIMALDI